MGFPDEHFVHMAMHIDGAVAAISRGRLIDGDLEVHTMIAADLDPDQVLAVVLNLGMAAAHHQPAVRVKLLNCLNLIGVEFEQKRKTEDRAEDGDDPPWN